MPAEKEAILVIKTEAIRNSEKPRQNKKCFGRLNENSFYGVLSGEKIFMSKYIVKQNRQNESFEDAV